MDDLGNILHSDPAGLAEDLVDGPAMLQKVKPFILSSMTSHSVHTNDPLPPMLLCVVPCAKQRAMSSGRHTSTWVDQSTAASCSFTRASTSPLFAP